MVIGDFMLSEIEIDEKLYEELKLRSDKTGVSMLNLVNKYIYSGFIKEELSKPKSNRPKTMSLKEMMALSKKDSSESDDIF